MKCTDGQKLTAMAKSIEHPTNFAREKEHELITELKDYVVRT